MTTLDPSASAAPPSLEFVMEVHVDVAAAVELGNTHGYARRVVPIIGGNFAGPTLEGKVLALGEDWQFTRPDGVVVLHARYVLETEQGERIAVENRGFRHGRVDLAARIEAGEPVPPSEYYFLTRPVFETASPALQWMTRTVFIGKAERQTRSVVLQVWAVDIRT
jgi:hypothetical protein